MSWQLESVCIICHEPITGRNAFTWTHAHGVECGTGDGSTAYPQSNWRDQLPIAVRSTIHEAKRAFAAGSTVIVSSDGRRDGATMRVFPDTTTITKSDTTTWEWLESMRKEWASKYPRQRYYIVTERAE